MATNSRKSGTTVRSIFCNVKVDLGSQQRIAIMNKERLSNNLMAWPEITAFCLELRKSFLRAKYDSIEENELTKKLFSEIVAKKEKKWTSKKRS